MDIPLWIAAVRQHLLPGLPGTWQMSGPDLVSGDVGWTAQLISVQPSDYSPGFYLDVFVQLLAVPREHFVSSNGFRLGHEDMGGYWDEPANSDAYETVMAQIRGLILAEAIPHFKRYGGVDGYLAFLLDRMKVLTDRGGEWIDMNIDEALVYIHLLHGDLASAVRAAGYADLAADADAHRANPRPWVGEAHDRVRHVIHVARRDLSAALDILRGNAQATAAAVHLPLPTI